MVVCCSRSGCQESQVSLCGDVYRKSVRVVKGLNYLPYSFSSAAILFAEFFSKRSPLKRTFDFSKTSCTGCIGVSHETPIMLGELLNRGATSLAIEGCVKTELMTSFFFYLLLATDIIDETTQQSLWRFARTGLQGSSDPANAFCTIKSYQTSKSTRCRRFMQRFRIQSSVPLMGCVHWDRLPPTWPISGPIYLSPEYHKKHISCSSTFVIDAAHVTC